jgi:hypothetical protein
VPYGDASVAVGDAMMGGLSTYAACFILNSCLINGSKIALSEGTIPPVFKSGNIDGKVEKDFFGNTTSPFDMKKVIAPTDEEMERNPRSRSAKLRIGIKK